jgi:hypothetical protein
MPILVPVHRIKFKYNNAIHEASARKFTSKKHRWYLIAIAESPNFVIAPATEQSPDIKATWLQENIPGEFIHPKEFIQAVGSGLEAAGIV